MCKYCERAWAQATGTIELDDALEAAACEQLASSTIGAVVLTGPLGAGKTSVLNHVLRSHAALPAPKPKLAVLVNEFGATPIDGMFLDEALQLSEAEVVVQADGCLCCRVRDDLGAALAELADKQVANLVIVETSGASEVPPVLATFARDPRVLSRYQLASVVAVVDAPRLSAYIANTLDDMDTRLIRQALEYADLVTVSKVDLVDRGARQKCVSVLQQQLSSLVDVVCCRNGAVNVSQVLEPRRTVDPSDRVRAAFKADSSATAHAHHGLKSTALRASTALDEAAVEALLQRITTLPEFSAVRRVKGRIAVRRPLSDKATVLRVETVGAHMDVAALQGDGEDSVLVLLGTWDASVVEELERLWKLCDAETAKVRRAQRAPSARALDCLD